uniref:Uncharacterized protein n=1 Tax=Timema poppense TaxID=170557 RepID=A0A7R9DYH1_TIMPO|nr:unnamed protein product [Timema poppensis]
MFQAGSVTSPRKLLDLEVVSNEGLDCPTTAPPKDTQRCKQMLLEIEKSPGNVCGLAGYVGTGRKVPATWGSERVLDNIALSTFDNLFARSRTSGATGFGSHEIRARNHRVIYPPLLPGHVQRERRAPLAREKGRNSVRQGGQ